MITSLSRSVEGTRSGRKKKAILAWKLPPAAWKWYTAVEVKNPETGDLLNTTEKQMGFLFYGERA